MNDLDALALEPSSADIQVIPNEMALVGAAISSVQLAESVYEVVKPDDMARRAHGLILQAAADLSGRGDPVTPVTVLTELTKRGQSDACGGADYVHQLFAHAATPSQVAFHAREVLNRAAGRKLEMTGLRYLQMGRSANFDRTEGIEQARTLLDTAFTEDTARQDAAQARDVVWEVLEELEHGTDDDVITTGYADLDAVTSIRPGQLIIVAARPGCGKSTFGLDVARHVGITRREGVLFVSLEMSRKEVVTRMLSAEGRINMHALQKRRLADADWDRLRKAKERIDESNIVIVDTPHAGIGTIRARLRHMQRNGGVKIGIIDYLGLLRTTGRHDNRQQEVAALSRELKVLAREFGIPLIVLAQVNRNPESRGDKRPVPSDIRESGAIEADADAVIMLHRPDMYERDDPRAGEIDLHVDKNRHGPQTTITCCWQGHYSRIVNFSDFADAAANQPAARGHLRPVP